MSEKNATNQVEQYVDHSDLLKLNVANTDGKSTGAATKQDPKVEDTTVTPILKAKPVPAEVPKQPTVFSFKIEEQIQTLEDLNEKFLDAKIAVEVGESVYNIRPSSKDSSSYLIYKKELERTTNDYFEYLKSLTKINTFEYKEDKKSQNKKKHERFYYDFYRIANDSNLAIIDDPKDIDNCDVAEQLKQYVKDIDKRDVMMRYVVGCIYAVSVTLTRGNYAASPAKQLENLLHSINQN
tara:strand:- start:153 stop:866 length:714 start_codon:yes stop_codon:yes gene_type:complete